MAETDAPPASLPEETVDALDGEDEDSVRPPLAHGRSPPLTRPHAQEIAAMKKRVQEMEAEAAKLREMQAAAEAEAAAASAGGGSADGADGGGPMDTEDESAAVDSRSIYVGNVCALPLRASPRPLTPRAHTGRLRRDARGDPGALPGVRDDQPRHHPLRQVHGAPEGVRRARPASRRAPADSQRAHRYAYVEFAEPEHVDTALALDSSLFRGRLLKVGFPAREHAHALTGPAPGDGEADEHPEL
jgi:hypothetical protein